MIQPSNTFSPEEILERVRILRYKVHEKKIGEVWEDFTVAGFRPILIKGWAAAQFYPKPYRREFTDLDLLIAPEQFRDAKAFLKNSERSYPVDLHHGARRHDTLSFAEIFAESETVKCGSVEVRVPRAEDHLRILCVHWLTDGGAYREKLWDVYYAVANRSSNFDWERLLNVVSPVRRRWIVCTIGLAHKYLGLPVEDTPIAAETENLPSWLSKTVEKEWRSEVKLQPLPSFRHRRKEFKEQLKKRFPPNPIHAAVSVEGSFDKRIRIGYQLENFFRRLLPLLERFCENLKSKIKNDY
ncbi:MAG: nucleotidyltransferase family protein [Pyrinomonadaceae bacterium]